MAIVVTPVDKSLALTEYTYSVTGLVNGVNVVALPTPPATGSFPPLGDWTPTVILCFPYQNGAGGNLVTPDYNSITNVNGLVTFNLYATGATNVLLFVY